MTLVSPIGEPESEPSPTVGSPGWAAPVVAAAVTGMDVAPSVGSPWTDWARVPRATRIARVAVRATG